MPKVPQRTKVRRIIKKDVANPDSPRRRKADAADRPGGPVPVSNETAPALNDPTANQEGMISPAVAMDATSRPPADAIGICLSGGGFRAMLYHAGALWRLNELGLLTQADRISSVSGGSITAGWLALLWAGRRWGHGPIPADDFRDHFVAGLRRLAASLVDVPCVLRGFAPWHNVGQEIAACYDRLLFGGATLQSLPDHPRFVILASNLQTGALWRFSKPYMGDYKVGRIFHPELPLAVAVAASSAFPPVLSPLELDLRDAQYQLDGTEILHEAPYTTRPVLSDGGVYDNIGLEPLKDYTTVLASDGGRPFRADPAPWRIWPLQLWRVLDCFQNQVQALRVRDLIESYRAGRRKGAYWGIATPLSRYGNAGGLSCADETTARLADVSTGLAPLDGRVQEELINWGYASCATSLALHFPQPGPAPAWPYPKAALG